jgi:hypothetical protein
MLSVVGRPELEVLAHQINEKRRCALNRVAPELAPFYLDSAHSHV